MSDEADVLDLENRRCAAISSHDFDGLRGLLADDYMHVFGNGVIRDKEEYVQTVTVSPRVPERSNMVVRVYGDTAVLVGDLLNTITREDGRVDVVDAVATQVAVRKGGKWQFVSCQLTARRRVS